MFIPPYIPPVSSEVDEDIREIVDILPLIFAIMLLAKIFVPFFRFISRWRRIKIR